MSAQRVRMLPVASACSGCSSAGLVADHVARSLDNSGLVEMGSIAGIGAAEPQQLTKAKSRFPVIAIDGCLNACARRCLERNGVEPAKHFVLSSFGIAKRSNTAGFDFAEAQRILRTIAAQLG